MYMYFMQDQFSFKFPIRNILQGTKDQSLKAFS